MIFATKMTKYLEKPFREGGTGPDGYDCVGLIYRYLRDSGKDIPDTFRQWDRHTHFHLARGSKKIEKSVLRDWLLSLGREIPVNEIIAGDVLLLKFIADVTPAIYLGNGKVLTVFAHKGVSPLQMNKHIYPMIAVRVT